MVSGRFLWLSQDDKMRRATEVAAQEHLGGMFLLTPYNGIGPHKPCNVVFTHNVNNTMTDGVHDVHTHCYDKVNEYVAASALLALSDNLLCMSELHNLDLLDSRHKHGWQHIQLNTAYEKALQLGRAARRGSC